MSDQINFQISGLPAAPFQPLLALSDEELRTHRALRVVADRKPGYPCRVSLKDAEPGETLLLINYQHLGVASPYQSRHAIYVRQGARETKLEVNEIPEVLRTRLLYLPGLSSEEKKHRLARMTYLEFLRDVVKVTACL